MTGLPVLKVCFGPLLQSAAFTASDYINSLPQKPHKKHAAAKSSKQLENFYMCNNVTTVCVIGVMKESYKEGSKSIKTCWDQPYVAGQANE